MTKLPRFATMTALALSLFSVPASAEMRSTQYGAWVTSETGIPMCGMYIIGNNGRVFHVKYHAHDQEAVPFTNG